MCVWRGQEGRGGWRGIAEPKLVGAYCPKQWERCWPPAALSNFSRISGQRRISGLAGQSSVWEGCGSHLWLLSTDDQLAHDQAECVNIRGGGQLTQLGE